jgi:nucleotide-binding universal stress UspA family protein
MFTTVLVPTDGSPLAERALPFAEELAQAADGRLVLLRAAADAASLPHAEAELAMTAERLRQAGILVDTQVAIGKAGELIVDTAAGRDADLIVMSTHGRSGIGRWLYGSVADHVLRHAPVPILLVPASCAALWGEGTERPGSVLVPLDGSKAAEEVLDTAVALGRVLRADVLLLRVLLPTHPAQEYGRELPYTVFGPYVPAGNVRSGRRPLEEGPADATGAASQPTLPERQLAAQQYLEQIAGLLRSSTSGAVGTLVSTGTPATAIAAVSREQNVVAIAMATHGRGGLARAVLGSVATGVLHQACVPVLLTRPGTVAKARSTAQADTGLRSKSR